MIYDNVRCVHLFQNVNDVSYLNLTKTTNSCYLHE